MGKRSVGRSATLGIDDFKKLAGSEWMRNAQDRDDLVYFGEGLRPV